MSKSGMVQRTIYIVDTNVVVSGVIGTDVNSPPACVVDAMLEGAFAYAVSPDLLDEYAAVLSRPRIVRLHLLDSAELDTLLADLVANAIWREPLGSDRAPDPDDDHLWALLGSFAHACLITGDAALVASPPESASVISPRSFVERLRSTPTACDR